MDNNSDSSELKQRFKNAFGNAASHSILFLGQLSSAFSLVSRFNLPKVAALVALGSCFTGYLASKDFVKGWQKPVRNDLKAEEETGASFVREQSQNQHNPKL